VGAGDSYSLNDCLGGPMQNQAAGRVSGLPLFHQPLRNSASPPVLSLRSDVAGRPFIQFHLQCGFPDPEAARAVSAGVLTGMDEYPAALGGGVLSERLTTTSTQACGIVSLQFRPPSILVRSWQFRKFWSFPARLLASRTTCGRLRSEQGTDIGGCRLTRLALVDYPLPDL